MAAAFALRARQLGLRVLVLTVDPARRLATTLQLDLSGASESTVPVLEGGRAMAGTLAAAIIDSKKIFDAFVQEHSTDPELFRRLSRNRLYQQLSTTLAGSQEFTALERLLQANESKRFDLVILDTPPTQHAMDFLSAPERIRGLFQEAVTRWFMGPDESSKHRLIGAIIGRGARAAFKSLETLTGARFIEEMLDFFRSMRSIQKVLRERSDQVNQLLRSQQTMFVLVTSFDSAKLLEAAQLRDHLDRTGYRLGACILNRAFPESLPETIGSSVDVPERLRGDVQALLQFYAKVKADHAERFRLFAEFEAKMHEKTASPAQVATVRVPEYRQDVFGLTDLESLATFLGESDG